MKPKTAKRTLRPWTIYLQSAGHGTCRASRGTKAQLKRQCEGTAMTNGNGNNTKPELLVRSLLHQAG
ncbi:hypothetical protein P4B35_17715 [Pontiellaceae bacterium B12227]|nr:hypothetical protein [Pontiellaceae bacterium B12227]